MDLQQALDIVSYKIGLRFGEAALGDDVFLDEKIHEAILDKASGNEQQFDLKQYMIATKMVSAERSRLFTVKNQQFLVDNALKDGITTTESGVQYEILQQGPGTGPRPSAESQVTVNYTGTLIDSMVFDASADRGGPATFGVSKVIKGWQEAIQLMQVGDKYRFYVPQELGYGDRGVGSDIPPFATLIFEVELLEISQVH